jgi:integrase
MKIAVRGVKTYTSKGKTYCYHRATGKRILASFGSAAFFAEVDGLDKNVKTPPTRAGTVGLLFTKYEASDKFSGLAPRTQTDYRKVINWLAPLDGMPLGLITPPFAAGMRDKAKTEKGFRFANYVLAVFGAALSWGAEHGHIEKNPIKGHVRKAARPKGMELHNRPWTAEERDLVIEAAPFHLRIPVALMRWAGLRTGDALTMPRTAYDGHAIQVRTRKTGQLVWIPCPAPLRALLDAIPSHGSTTLAVNSRGLPWTGNGFRSVLGKLIRALEQTGKVGRGLSPHGLRHSFAVDLRELGYDERTIADALGQAELETARLYARGADLRKKMTAVMGAVEKLDTRRKNKRKSVDG